MILCLSIFGATGQKFVSISCFVCEENKTLNFESSFGQSLFPQLFFLSSVCFVSPARAKRSADKLFQVPSVLQQLSMESINTLDEEIDADQLRRKVLSKRTSETKKTSAVDELACSLVTGPTDASKKWNDFYCWICEKGVAVLNHYINDILLLF